MQQNEDGKHRDEEEENVRSVLKSFVDRFDSGHDGNWVFVDLVDGDVCWRNDCPAGFHILPVILAGSIYTETRADTLFKIPAVE